MNYELVKKAFEYGQVAVIENLLYQDSELLQITGSRLDDLLEEWTSENKQILVTSVDIDLLAMINDSQDLAGLLRAANKKDHPNLIKRLNDKIDSLIPDTDSLIRVCSKLSSEGQMALIKMQTEHIEPIILSCTEKQRKKLDVNINAQVAYHFKQTQRRMKASLITLQSNTTNIKELTTELESKIYKP